jgi:hypothetical protein
MSEIEKSNGEGLLSLAGSYYLRFLSLLQVDGPALLLSFDLPLL